MAAALSIACAAIAADETGFGKSAGVSLNVDERKRWLLGSRRVSGDISGREVQVQVGIEGHEMVAVVVVVVLEVQRVVSDI